MKSVFCLTGCIIFAYLLLTQPQEVILGTMAGGKLCIDLLLPSLFPFMALSAFLARSGAGELLARPFLPMTRLLRLPDAAAPVLLASMIGGYPTGAQAVLSFPEAGRLEAQDASRLLRCSVNAGPAFVVIAVGERMFGSSSLGWRLLAAQVFSSLALCLIFCRNGGNPRGVSISSRPSFSSALVESVSQATRGILSIGSYVLLVSILLELLRPLPLPPVFRCALTGFLEVTTGCSAAALLGGRTGALLAAFFLAFGGCSVCLQVLSFVKPSGIRTNGFFRARLLGGLLCTAFLLPFLPDIPEPTVGAALISASSALLPAANSPNRLLGAFCMMAMTAQLFTRIDGCTVHRRG